MDANNLNPSTTDGQKTDVLLALNKQTNKVNAVKGIDEDGKSYCSAHSKSQQRFYACRQEQRPVSRLLF